MRELIEEGQALAAAREGESRTRVEPEPSQEQDDRSRDAHGQIVTGHGVRGAVRVEPADAWANHHGPCEGDGASDHVYDPRPREVDGPVAQPDRPAEVGEPTPAPDPAADQRAKQGACQAVKRPELSDSAGNRRRMPVRKDYSDVPRNAVSNISVGTVLESRVPRADPVTTAAFKAQSWISMACSLDMPSRTGRSSCSGSLSLPRTSMRWPDFCLFVSR